MTVSVASRTVREVMEPWCAAGLTGALRVLGPPGGTVYLVDGLVSYAECPLVCGVDRLLTASGRLPAEVWRSALATGRAGRRVGQVLVEQGQLSLAEVELLARTALFDAASVLFGASADTRFEGGVTPVLGTMSTLDLAVVDREVERRHRALAGAWADSAIDTVAVLPARRLPGHHVTLTAPQWEILANADRRRTPLDLARHLGRDAFTVMLEVRRMARAGLVEPGTPRQAPGRALQSRYPSGQPSTGGPVTGQPSTGGPVTGQPSTGDPVTGQPSTGDPVTGQRPADTRPADRVEDDLVETVPDAPLPHRLDGRTTVPRPYRPDTGPPDGTGPDPPRRTDQRPGADPAGGIDACPDSVLLRIRRALQAL